MERTLSIRYVFLFGLAILPFVFWPTAVVPYEIPRVYVVQAWIELLSLIGVLSIVWNRKHPRHIPATMLYLLLALIGTAVLGSVFGIDIGKSIWGNYYRGDGLITLVHLVGLAFFLMVFWEKSWERILFLVVSTSSTLLALWTIIERFRIYGFLHIRALSGVQGIGVSFGQPKFLGGYLLIVLHFSVAMIQASKKQYLHLFWILAVIVQCAAIWFSGARSAVLGVIFFFCLSFILNRKLLEIKIFRIAMLVIVSVIIIVGTTWYIKIKTPYSITAETHERIAIKGILAFLKRPITGWGWANFDYAFAAVDWPDKFYHDVYVDKAHSHFIEILTTTGIIGFALYMGIIWKTLKRLIKSYPASKYLLFSFLLFLFHSQTNVISISEEVMFWIIVGIVGSRDGVTTLTQKN